MARELWVDTPTLRAWLSDEDVSGIPVATEEQLRLLFASEGSAETNGAQDGRGQRARGGAAPARAAAPARRTARRDGSPRPRQLPGQLSLPIPPSTTLDSADA